MGAFVPIGSDGVAALSLSSAGVSAYVNGAPTASLSKAPVPVYSTTAALCIGFYYGIANYTSNSLIYWAAWWNRLLSPNAHFAIGCNVLAARSLLFDLDDDSL
jgi:hypothetical protein